MQQNDRGTFTGFHHVKARAVSRDIAVFPRPGGEDRLLGVEGGELAGRITERGGAAQSRADDGTVPIAGVDA
jgi:hypothetical protein